MADYHGFWSYVHKDDDAETGRIVQLALDLKDQFEMMAGEELRLFLDRTELEWGHEWRARIDSGLETVAFFIPVLTPRYFQSSECRRELHEFIQRAELEGVSELILPLLYVKIPELRDEAPEDALMAKIKKIQYVDLTDIKFEERTSTPYRRKVAELAEQLVDINRRFEEQALVKIVEPTEPPQEAAGLMDQIADMEDEFPKLTVTLLEISNCIATFGDLTELASEELDKSDKRSEGARGRVLVARKLAASIWRPTAEIHALGTQFTSQLHVVDDGIRALIEIAHDADETDKPAAEELFESVNSLIENANTSMQSVNEMINGAATLERVSRDLRTPLRKLRSGLTALMEGVDIMNEWQELMDQAT
jgi:hypothetical protein